MAPASFDPHVTLGAVAEQATRTCVPRWVVQMYHSQNELSLCYLPQMPLLITRRRSSEASCLFAGGVLLHADLSTEATRCPRTERLRLCKTIQFTSSPDTACFRRGRRRAKPSSVDSSPRVRSDHRLVTRALQEVHFLEPQCSAMARVLVFHTRTVDGSFDNCGSEGRVSGLTTGRPVSNVVHNAANGFDDRNSTMCRRQK